MNVLKYRRLYNTLYADRPASSFRAILTLSKVRGRHLIMT